MKDTNKEKSPFATFSMDTVKPSGEKPEKEEFIGVISSDDDLRHKGAKVK
jgi:hypothetical protein